MLWVMYYFVLFFKQKPAYEMRISDWSSDVCSSDLRRQLGGALVAFGARRQWCIAQHHRAKRIPGAGFVVARMQRDAATRQAQLRPITDLAGKDATNGDRKSGV